MPDDKQDAMKTWMMVILTVVFVALYVGALFGLIPGPKDQQTLTRIESVVFVIIGYYFGRLPAQATEKTLKGEIERQTQKADQAEADKSAAEQESSTLKAKVKSAKAALASAAPGTSPAAADLTVNLSKPAAAALSADALRQSMIAVANVLEA